MFALQSNISYISIYLSNRILFYHRNSIHLFSETASLCEPRFSARWLTEHNVALTAQHHRLCVTENGRNLEAAGAFNIHEERIRRLHQALQLVRVPMHLGSGVKKIDRHFLVPH